ncbi:hypothetical protein KQI65_10075 [bacterium]|nr:hypothetical protein [bacterium]
MKFRMLYFALAAGLLLSGCYYDSEEALYPSLSSNCDTTNVTFAGSIVPILSANCYSCHSNANSAQFGSNIRLEAYDDVKQNLDRLRGAVNWQPGYTPMPQNSAQLPDCSIRIIEIWIAQGAPNSSPFTTAGGAQ